jgi:hypothetical protein
VTVTGYGQRPANSYARRIAAAMDAPNALRPDMEGLGLTLAEGVAELLLAVRENTLVQRESTAATLELIAYLRRRHGEE